MTIQDSAIDFSYLHDIGVPGMIYGTCDMCIMTGFVVDETAAGFPQIRPGQLVRGYLQATDELLTGGYQYIDVSRPALTDAISYGIVVDDRSHPNYSDARDNQWYSPSADNRAILYSKGDTVPVMQQGIIMLTFDSEAITLPFTGQVGVYKDDGTVPWKAGTFTALTTKLPSQVEYFALNTIRLLAEPRLNRNGEIQAPAYVDFKSGAEIEPSPPGIPASSFIPLFDEKLAHGWLENINVATDSGGNFVSWFDIGPSPLLLTEQGTVGDINVNPDGSIQVNSQDPTATSIVSIASDVNTPTIFNFNSVNLVFFIVGASETLAGGGATPGLWITYDSKDQTGIDNVIYIQLVQNTAANMGFFDNNGVGNLVGINVGIEPVGSNNLLTVQYNTVTPGFPVVSVSVDAAVNDGAVSSAGPAPLDFTTEDIFSVGNLRISGTGITADGTYRAVLVYQDLLPAEVTAINAQLKAQYSIP